MTATDAKKSPWTILKANWVWIVLAIVVAVIVLLAIPMIGASEPAYFSRYTSLSGNTHTVSVSSHKDIPCESCHVDPNGPIAYRVAVAADFYLGLVSRRAGTKFVQFPKPTREACRKCHVTDWSTDIKRTSAIPHPAHLRVASETRNCVNCHKWTAHEESAMAKHKKMPFSGVCVAYGCHVGTKKSTECYTCHHVLGETGAKWKNDHPAVVARVGANGCLEMCHEVAQCTQCHITGKRPVFKGRPTQTGLKIIEAQHVKKSWMTQHGTEALKDRSKCLLCHVSDAECQACHARRPAFHGPTDTWIGQHTKPGKDEKRCLECHKKQECEDCHKKFKEMR